MTGEKRYLPVTVQVNYSNVVSKARGQPWPIQNVLGQQTAGRFAPLLQQDHSSTVIGSWCSSYNRQAAALHDVMAGIKRES